MKQQDVIIVIVIVVIAGMLSFFVSSSFITPPDQKETAEVVSAIEPSFPLPDNKVFNAEAINPTVKITINPNANPQPFADQEQ